MPALCRPAGCSCPIASKKRIPDHAAALLSSPCLHSYCRLGCSCVYGGVGGLFPLAAYHARLDSTYLKAYYRRGSAYMALGKFKLAVKDFRKVRSGGQRQGSVVSSFLPAVFVFCRRRRWCRCRGYRCWRPGTAEAGRGGHPACRSSGRWRDLDAPCCSTQKTRRPNKRGGRQAGRFSLSVIYSTRDLHALDSIECTHAAGSKTGKNIKFDFADLVDRKSQQTKKANKGNRTTSHAGDEDAAEEQGGGGEAEGERKDAEGGRVRCCHHDRRRRASRGRDQTRRDR